MNKETNLNESVLSRTSFTFDPFSVIQAVKAIATDKFSVNKKGGKEDHGLWCSGSSIFESAPVVAATVASMVTRAAVTEVGE